MIGIWNAEVWRHNGSERGAGCRAANKSKEKAKSGQRTPREKQLAEKDMPTLYRK